MSAYLVGRVPDVVRGVRVDLLQALGVLVSQARDEVPEAAGDADNISVVVRVHRLQTHAKARRRKVTDGDNMEETGCNGTKACEI